jgi:hypothetical protein
MPLGCLIITRHELFRLLKDTLDALISGMLRADSSGEFKEDIDRLEDSVSDLEVASWSAKKRKSILARASLQEP